MVPPSGAIKSSSVRNLCSDTASVWATRRPQGAHPRFANWFHEPSAWRDLRRI